MIRRLTIAFTMLLAASATTAQQTPSARVVPIQITGDPAARFSMVVMGDGYTAEEMPKFRAHLDKHLNIMWSIEPFRSYRSYINVYAVEVVSPVSGITCDPAHREQRATPLGLNFSDGCTNPNARGIVLQPGPARTYAALATPHFDQILIIANTDTYGGIGGSVATTSGGNAISPLITPHELGHSLGRLQDEYTYSARGVAGGANPNTQEPASPHHTVLTEEQMRTQQAKWWRWLGEPSESGGVIGRFEGGQQRTTGIWRPSKHSMMISLGYYFDQVSREQMVRRISAQVDLIAAALPADAPIARDATVWIETAQPVYHELDVTWRVDDRVLPNPNNARHLDLRSLDLAAGSHTVSVTVIDPTPFVRDPEIRDSVLTARRTWRVTDDARTTPVWLAPTSAAYTQTDKPVGGKDVVYVETTPAGTPVTWQLNGRTVPNNGSTRFHLARQNLPTGTHTLIAHMENAADAAMRMRTWRVDNTGPTVAYTLSDAAATITNADGTKHFYMRDQFTMKLEPKDDQPGYVVAEFRVNGDGWHHYYGWPDAPPGIPFLFTPRGTTIKELVYGSLSAEGLSPQPWEAREPGWGTHRIEYRAIDAAGNIGNAQEFRVTLMPSPACTHTITGRHSGNVRVQTGVTCINGATVTGSVEVLAGATLVATNATISGAVTATGARSIELLGTRVDGVVRVTGTGVAALFGADLRRNVVLNDNATTTLAGSTIGGALTCGGAAPMDLGARNTVRGRITGVCSQ